MLTYVLTPYSHPDISVRIARMSDFKRAMLWLCQSGWNPVSPMEKMPIVEEFNLPDTWDFWQTFAESLMDKCDHFIVVDAHGGWQDSVGVRAEIEYMVRAGKQGYVLSLVDEDTVNITLYPPLPD